jgi:5-hydroxyisourate hydrolase
MITTHVLDISIGRPGAAIAVELERADRDMWHLIGGGVTDDDGRLRTLTPAGPLVTGRYRIRFQTGAYFAARNVNGFYPLVEIQFTVGDADAHYHVPLLLSPFGFSTYRGS